MSFGRQTNSKGSEKENTVQVSILMGVYNAERTLEKALDSVLTQTFSAFELIACDDASTDSSLKILLRYRKKDPRIIVIRNRRNLGLGASLNRCLMRARGSLIARQDADDISSPDRLEKTVRYLLDKGLPFAACGVFVFDDKGVWSRRLYPEIVKRHDLARHNPFFHPTMVFRREVLEAADGYRVAPETRRAEDYDLVMRLASLGYIGQNLQEYLYYVYEPADAYLRHTWKTRLSEIRVRWQGYRTMRLPLRDYVFLAKPIFMMAVPHSVLRRFKELQWGR